MKVYKYVTSSEQLQELCNAFLTSITERKNSAIKVKDYHAYSWLDVDADYIIEIFDDGSYDSVGYQVYYDHHGKCVHYFNDDTNSFAVDGRVLKIIFNGFKFVVKHDTSAEYVEIMLNLKSKLEELFK